MALGLGGIALALSRTTPLKGLNFLLLTVWTVGLWGFTFVQFYTGRCSASAWD